MSPSIMIHDSIGVPPRGRGIRRLLDRIPTGLLLGTALLPVIVWFCRRLNDGSDEPFGLVPLLIAAGLAWKDRGSLTAGPAVRDLGAMLVLLATLMIPWAPPMVRAALALTGAGWILGFASRPGLCGLLVLSLPVVASLQFYAGYPLRLATAEGAVRLLQLTGATVARDGVGIDIGGALVAVDPACAGVRMLWHALVAAMALAAFHRLSWLATTVLGLLAFALVIPANAGRAAWLALEESGRMNPSGFSHEMIGWIAFAALLAPLPWLAGRHARRMQAPVDAGGRRSMVRPALAVCCVLAPFLLLGPPPGHAETVRAGGMPAAFSFNGTQLPLQAIPPMPEEEAFSRSFPGHIGVYRWDDHQVILRRVDRATRKLHPASDCLRAAGYSTGNAVTVTLADGTRWSRFHATRHGERLTIHERVVSECNADTWTDIPAWFWSALNRPLNGPWRAETVISR